MILTGCSKENDKSTPISVNTVDWYYLSMDGNDIRIAQTIIYKDSKAIQFDPAIYPEFFKLMLRNKDKIYTKEKPNSTKIHLIFNNYSALNSVYKLDKYNGKHTTFYVENDIAEEIFNLLGIYS